MQEKFEQMETEKNKIEQENIQLKTKIQDLGAKLEIQENLKEKVKNSFQSTKRKRALLDKIKILEGEIQKKNLEIEDSTNQKEKVTKKIKAITRAKGTVESHYRTLEMKIMSLSLILNQVVKAILLRQDKTISKQITKIKVSF